MGADPRFILAGRRILEVFWLGYWFYKFDEAARRHLIQEVVTLMREGILVTSIAKRRYSFDEIGAAVTEAESMGRRGKVLLVPEREDLPVVGAEGARSVQDRSIPLNEPIRRGKMTARKTPAARSS